MRGIASFETDLQGDRCGTAGVGEPDARVGIRQGGDLAEISRRRHRVDGGSRSSSAAAPSSRAAIRRPSPSGSSRSALGFGPVTAMACPIGADSGCHINPAGLGRHGAAGRMPTSDPRLYRRSDAGRIVGCGFPALILSVKASGYDSRRRASARTWNRHGSTADGRLPRRDRRHFLFLVVIFGATPAEGATPWRARHRADAGDPPSRVRAGVGQLPEPGPQPRRRHCSFGGPAIAEIWLFISRPI